MENKEKEKEKLYRVHYSDDKKGIITILIEQ